MNGVSDWVSLGIDAVAASGTLAALLFALWAIREARAARVEAQESGVRAFELEIVRELQAIVDNDTLMAELCRFPRPTMDRRGITVRLEMMARGGRYRWEDEFPRFAGLYGSFAATDGIASPGELATSVGVLRSELAEELIDAVRRRFSIKAR